VLLTTAATLIFLDGQSARDMMDSEKQLLQAAEKGRPYEVRQLFKEHGAKIMARTSNGRSLLHLAVSTEKVDVVALLLNTGAIIDDKDCLGRTPLSYACCRCNDVSVARLLSDKRVSVARLLLERGADPNIQDKNGMSPLHHAFRTGNVLAACLLLEKGADPTIKDRHGWTAPDVAKSNSRAIKMIQPIIQNTIALTEQFDTLTREKETLEEQMETMSGEKNKLLNGKEAMKQKNEVWKVLYEELEQKLVMLEDHKSELEEQVKMLLVEQKKLTQDLEILRKESCTLMMVQTKDDDCLQQQKTMSTATLAKSSQETVDRLNMKTRKLQQENMARRDQDHLRQQQAQTQRQAHQIWTPRQELIRRNADTPEAEPHEKKDPVANDEADDDKDHAVISVDAAVADEHVSAHMMALTRHFAVRSQGEDTWVENADDADQRAGENSLGALAATNINTTTLQELPTTPVALIMAQELAQLKATVKSNMAREEDFRKKIVELHRLIEQLIG
jgi:ankyrin repeat protein